jgi:hypothetical protein
VIRERCQDEMKLESYHNNLRHLPTKVPTSPKEGRYEQILSTHQIDVDLLLTFFSSSYKEISNKY